jgi:SlyX protein
MSGDDMQIQIEGLESIVAYQDQAIEELKEALAEHYRQIEALKREVARLSAQLNQVEAHPALQSGPEPPPPHY